MNPGAESTGRSSWEDDPHDSRDALTRVLAIEGRNALARVELAASELGRFDFAPFARDRIETIHDAVGQIDALLAKIDLLARHRASERCSGADVQVVGDRVLQRLRPTLEARGVTVGVPAGKSGTPALRVACPEAVVESMLCGLIRLVLASFQGTEELRFVVIPEPDSVIVGFEMPGAGRGSIGDSGDPESRMELDVQLAEWNATFVRQWPSPTREDGTKSGTARMGIRLPRSAVGN
ncbi:MAG TPA: hypothetical protein ENI85_14950 [Deltaproteobacteria bacterium]|nr:hypothetical protein [Deltaproteobacteria bacterium]